MRTVVIEREAGLNTRIAVIAQERCRVTEDITLTVSHGPEGDRLIEHHTMRMEPIDERVNDATR